MWQTKAICRPKTPSTTTQIEKMVTTSQRRRKRKRRETDGVSELSQIQLSQGKTLYGRKTTADYATAIIVKNRASPHSPTDRQAPKRSFDNNKHESPENPLEMWAELIIIRRQDMNLYVLSETTTISRSTRIRGDEGWRWTDSCVKHELQRLSPIKLH